MTRTFCLAALVFMSSAALHAQAPAAPPASDNYDELLARYLASVRTNQPASNTPSGLWMNGLLGDLRAGRVNDLVTIRVQESISASGSADSSLSKSSGANVGVSRFFGLESKTPDFLDLGDLAALSTDTDFNGAGSTTRAGVLSATLTARVAEVLPNGDLAIEGVREIDINGDRQIVVLTGIARMADIGPGNVVSSAVLGQFRIRYFGRGLIKDNLSPGWLVRILNKIF